MARGKHSAALFEKIKLDRPLHQQARPGLVRSLSRVFAGNGSPRPVIAMAPTSAPVAAAAPTPARIDVPAGVGGNAGSERRSAGARGGEFHLRMSYTGAVIAGFAGITIMAAAFLAGQRMPTTPRPTLSQVTVDQLRVQPPQPGVINVRRDVPPPSDYSTRNEPATSPNANRPNPAPPQAVPRKVRQTGLNYVLIQSYPPEEEKMAHEAVKLLTENGIDCTVERGVAGYGARWFSVVGLDGFAKVSNNPQLEAYTRKVKSVSERNAKKGSFKAFAPTPVKWLAKGVG